MAADDPAEHFVGVCPICLKEADARAEDCFSLQCTVRCETREGGDLAHGDCIKKFIGAGAKGSKGNVPKIPHSNFACPKGKTSKNMDAMAECKGLILHCRRLLPKSDSRAGAAAAVHANAQANVQAAADHKARKQDRAAAKAAAATAAPPKPKPKPPKLNNKPVGARPSVLPAVQRLPHIPDAPRADPLGRNLGGAPRALPPGAETLLAADAAAAAGGKAAKKNQRRAAKRREEASAGSAGWEAASANGSLTSDAVAGCGGGSSSTRAGGGSLMSSTRFVTDISAYHALLARHLGSDAGSELEYADSSEQGAESAGGEQPSPGSLLDTESRWSQPTEPEDGGDWQAVMAGKAARAHAAAHASHGAPDGARAADAAEPNPDELFEQELARALAESKRTQEEQQRAEREAQAALLARFQASHTQPGQQPASVAQPQPQPLPQLQQAFAQQPQVVQPSQSSQHPHAAAPLSLPAAAAAAAPAGPAPPLPWLQLGAQLAPPAQPLPWQQQPGYGAASGFAATVPAAVPLAVPMAVPVSFGAPAAAPAGVAPRATVPGVAAVPAAAVAAAVPVAAAAPAAAAAGDDDDLGELMGLLMT